MRSTAESTNRAAAAAFLFAKLFWPAPLWPAPFWPAPLWPAPLRPAPLWPAPLWPAPLWLAAAAALIFGFARPAAAQEEQDSGAPAAAEDEEPPAPPEPFDPELRLEEVTGTSVTVAWKSEQSAAGTVLVRPVRPGRADPNGWLAGGRGMIRPIPSAGTIMAREAEPAAIHRVRVDGLQPGSRYEVLAQPAEGDQPVEGLSFYTAPDAGRMQVLRLKVAVVVFTNVARDKDKDLAGARKPAPPEELERVRREIDEAVLFYFVNSGMRLFLDLDYFVTDEFFAVGNDEPYGVAYAGAENNALPPILAKEGKTIGDYDGLCFVSCEKHFDNGEWVYPASGGGTYGPLAPYPAGRSAWKSGCDNAWLLAHEFGHQIDALYDESKMSAYLFNHFQPWDDTAHCHGEHWDGNAWLLREWAGHVTREQQAGWRPGSLGFRYFTCRWGEVLVAMDEDADGVPDRDLELPLDEKRLGSSPKKPDTDGDGLCDLAEVMACNWVDYGLDEIWAGPPERHRCDPANPDTDGDGLSDGDDPAPLTAATTSIPAASPVLDGKIGNREWVWSAPFDDDAFQGTVYLAWDEVALYFGLAASAAPPALVRLFVDADRDGWYVGGDNFHVNIQPAGGCAGAGVFKAAGCAEFALHNCGVQDQWPFYDEAGLDAGAVEAAAAEDGSCVEVKILRNETRGLLCRPGETLGISVAVDPGTGTLRPGRRGMLTLFEPHTFCELVLR